MSNESIILRFDHKPEMIEQDAKAAHWHAYLSYFWGL